MSKLVRGCRSAMRNACTYAQWHEAASELDRLEGNQAWTDEDDSRGYDWRLLHARRRRMQRLLAAGDGRGLVHELGQGLHWNLGNLGNPRLYGRTHVGTKRLIEDYVATVVRALEFVAEDRDPAVTVAARRQFFADTARSFGRSALMLSGGATLGLFHVGVVKALYREDLLPDTISGSSAGSIVAATIATRTPAQMEELLDPDASFYHFWRVLRPRQILRRGVLMDQAQLREAIARNVNDLSFEEARRRSGLSINITVSPAGRNQPPRLLNHLTFPHLLLREAVLASCAVPLLFEPVMLYTRGQDGEREPYMPLLRWADGSLKSDLPAKRLRRLFNVNHTTVSQTNPHVLPFLRRGPASDPGLGGALYDFASASLRVQSQLLLRLGGASLPARKLRQGLRAAAAILDQDYRGNITILPELSIWRYAHVTANPKMEAVRRFILEGERATWPHIETVRTQTLISRTLDRCTAKLAGGETDDRPRAGGSAPNLHVVRDHVAAKRCGNGD